jgi:hypothetical protein
MDKHSEKLLSDIREQKFVYVSDINKLCYSNRNIQISLSYLLNEEYLLTQSINGNYDPRTNITDTHHIYVLSSKGNEYYEKRIRKWILRWGTLIIAFAALVISIIALIRTF